MAGVDDVLGTIEAIYAAGLDAEHWPKALARIAHNVGGIAATLEVFDRRAPDLIEFHSFGLPPANELAYRDGFATLNPRIPSLINGKPGSVITDYMVLDERAMRRDVFYADFLAPVGYRYFIGGILAVSEWRSSLFSVQRATRQGHVEHADVARMECLLPHVRQAFDMTQRLKEARDARQPFEAALDLLADGVMLTDEHGLVLHANEALQAMARRGDGMRQRKGVVEFADPAARLRFGQALGQVGRLGDGDPQLGEAADFTVARPSGAPA